MAGSSLLFLASSIGFHSRLEFLTRAERHDAAGTDRNLLPRLRIAPRPPILVAQIEIAKARQLHLLPLRQGAAHLFEKQIHQFARLALVQPELVEQRLGHFRLRQSHRRRFRYGCRCSLILAPSCACRSSITARTVRSASSSVRVRSKSCKIKPKARLFRPDSTPSPWYMSKTSSSFNSLAAATVTRSRTAAKAVCSGIVTEISRRIRGKRETSRNCTTCAAKVCS